MRTLFAGYFISLDGVVDSPQDWHFPYADAEVMGVVDDATQDVDALPHGPTHLRGVEGVLAQPVGLPLADFINDTPKYVATSSGTEVRWAPSTVLSGDVVAVGGRPQVTGRRADRHQRKRNADRASC